MFPTLTNEISNRFNENIFKSYMTENYNYQK